MIAQMKQFEPSPLVKSADPAGGRPAGLRTSLAASFEAFDSFGSFISAVRSTRLLLTSGGAE